MKKKKKRLSLIKFSGAVPEILHYQILSKGFLAMGISVFEFIRGLLLWRISRAAFTSGDIPFLMRSWQGWCLLLLAAVTLYFYVIFDVVAVILIADHVLHGKPIKVRQILTQSFRTIPRFLSISGVFLVFYVSIIAPLCGASIGISLTKRFFMPYFITSVIDANPLYAAAYYGLMLILYILGVIYFMTFQYVVLDGRSVPDAMKASRKAILKNWPGYLKDYIIFFVKFFLFMGTIYFITYLLPAELVPVYVEDDVTRRAILIFISRIRWITQAFFNVLLLYFHMMLLNVFYERAEGKDDNYVRVRRKGKVLLLLEVLLVNLVLAAFSYLGAVGYDDIYPYRHNDRIAAHRAGGTLGNENTVRGLERAIARGAYAAEIDVQRTKDGHYIINHDNDFYRTTGVRKAPRDMTLEEIKKLKISGYSNGSDPEEDPVATMEEMLDASRGRIRLLIELKGNTADLRMAEDVYQMVMERGMLEQVAFISLDYALLDSIEKKYPEIDTGYLCFMAFGSLADMNVDILLLEEETATEDNILTIHNAGKKVGVWTVNTSSTIKKYLLSDIDMIITDEVEKAEEIDNELLGQTELEAILNRYSFE